MSRIELPDGQWAQLREDLSKAPRRYHKAIKAAIIPAAMAMRRIPAEFKLADGNLDPERTEEIDAVMSAEDLEVFLDTRERVSEAQIIALVTAWSYPVPVSLEALDDLPADAFDALTDACEPRTRTAPAVGGLAALADPSPPPAASSA